jgi:hypothetical protein
VELTFSQFPKFSKELFRSCRKTLLEYIPTRTDSFAFCNQESFSKNSLLKKVAFEKIDLLNLKIFLWKRKEHVRKYITLEMHLFTGYPPSSMHEIQSFGNGYHNLELVIFA